MYMVYIPVYSVYAIYRRVYAPVFTRSLSLPLTNYTKLIRIAPANTARSVSNPRKLILYKITVFEVSGRHVFGIESLKLR